MKTGTDDQFGSNPSFFNGSIRLIRFISSAFLDQQTTFDTSG